MGTLASSVSPVQPERLRSFVLPREHGAWGMLLIPLATGASVGLASGRGALPIVLFATAALSLFALRTPVEAWLGISALRPSTDAERRVVIITIVAYGAVALFSVGWLLVKENALALIFIGIAAAIASGLQASLKHAGHQGRVASQMVGALGLTSTAAGSYYVLTGVLDQLALILWAVNWLFAANQIHFVQLRIRGARAGNFREKFELGKWFLIGEALTVLMLAMAWGLSVLPGLAALAFVPVLLRGLYWFLEGEKPLEIHRLGFAELAHALGFGVVLILAYLR